MPPHVIASEGELPEVGVDCAYMGPEGAQVVFVRKCKSTVFLAATQVPEKGVPMPMLWHSWLVGCAV